MSKLVYLGHASFLIKGNEFSLVVDPYRNMSVPNMTFPKVEEVDAVFCSHSHFDHDASKLVKIKNDPTPVKAVTIVVPHDHEGGALRGKNSIRMFDVDGYKIVHLGDTGCILDKETLAPIKNCDVLLAPINGFFTISPDELKEICKIVNPRIVVPMHYYMKKYNSGYPDDNMFERFIKLFPEYQYLKNEELDLNKYKDYQGALIFDKYLQ